MDIASGFNGRIDTYTAVAGDTDTLTVTVDGSAVSLRGVAVGSTTVTVTAINAAGRAARSFNVTVNALTAPQTASTPTARTIAVGAELPIHIADAFSGIIATYGATSSDTTIATTTADGPTVTLTGAAAGTATVTLTAANAAGRATATLPVTVQVPEELAIAVAAPSHCLGSEGTLAPGGGRRGVGHIDLTYHITGGAPPYTITSPDAPGTTHTEPTGTLTIPCAQRGIDLTTAGPEVNVVEAGPRTLTLTATDNTATTTTTNIQVEVAENAYTTEYNGGQMHEGKTYILGTPDQWVLATLPQGLTLQFRGLSEHNTAHFTEPTTGTQIILDWTNGTELGRHTPSDTTTTTRTTRNTNTKQARTTAALAIKTPTGLTYGAGGPDWRPYPHLPDSKDLVNTQVAVHPNMFNGEEIRVCADTTSSAVKEHVKLAAKEWNDKTKARNPQFPRDVFEYVPDCDDGNIDVTVEVTLERLISNSDKCARMVKACAQIIVSGNNPPTITGDTIFATPVRSVAREAMVHELGHFLGLGDYFNKNNSKCINPSSAAIKKQFASVMAGGKCREISVEGWEVQGRDLDDLHTVYHPGAREGMFFFAHGSGSWKLYAGGPPADEAEVDAGGPYYVSNAERYVISRRDVGSRDAWGYQGWFTRDLAWEWLLPGLVPGNDYRYWLPLVGTLDEITGKEFAVVGITGGDIEQTSRRGVQEHATWQFPEDDTGWLDDTEWSLGTPLIVYGPPAKPENLVVIVRDKDVVLSWSSVPGATRYYVHVYRPNAEDPFRSDRLAADPSSCSMQATISGLTARVTYGFRVEAERAGVLMRSELSEQVTARPQTSSGNPRGMGRDIGSGDGTSGSDGGAARSGSCTIPVEVDPIVEQSGVCPADEHTWTERAVGERFKCDRLDTAPVTPGERVVSCPSVTPPYAVLDVDGEEKCRRVLDAAPTTSLGDPECEDGFTPVSGGTSCSKTDREASTSTPSCPSGYELLTIQGQVCYRSVPATASTSYLCSGDYSLVSIPMGGQECRKTLPASSKTSYSCSTGYSLVTFFVQPGVVGYRCEKSVPAAANTTYSCSGDYSLVSIPMGGQECRKTLPASSKTSYSCSTGYSLVTFFVQPGMVGYRCEKSVPAAANTTYSCSTGYSLVSIPMGGQYCRKTTAATATYSCDTGYTLSGTTCSKYTYTSPTGTTCPSGYTPFFNGFAHLCRKKLTATATVTYSCTSGTLSGSSCVLTATPTSETTYSCTSGTLSGSICVFTTAPSFTYDCDDAPNGYTLSDTDCIKTTTQAPTRPTIYTCPATYTRIEPTDPTSAPTCEKIDIIDATVITTPASCPTAPNDPPYQLYEEHVAGTIKHTCERTITIDALTVTTHSCPKGYTVHGNGTEHTCRLNPPPTPIP